MNSNERGGVIRLSEVRARIPGPAGERAVIAMERGTLNLALSVPLPPNNQTPHVQDELYFVVQGHGVLFSDGKRDPFEAGDVLFVAAGCEHHYEQFSDDLVLWRVFYGVEGGEIPPKFSESDG